MEGLSVQLAHSLHHLGFVFAPHVDLAGDADTATKQGFVSMPDQDFVVLVGASVARGNRVVDHHAGARPLAEVPVGTHQPLLCDNGVHLCIDEGLNQHLEVFQTGRWVVRRTVVNGNPYTSPIG